MNKIIIYTTPVGLQKVFAFVNGELVDQRQCLVDDLFKVFNFAKVNGIKQIDITGVEAYAREVGRKIREEALAHYDCEDINIEYVEVNK